MKHLKRSMVLVIYILAGEERTMIFERGYFLFLFIHIVAFFYQFISHLNDEYF